jgi:hypothetical protein
MLANLTQLATMATTRSTNQKFWHRLTPGVITPKTPGNFSSIRSVPVVPDPRYFTKEEADAMKGLAKEKTDGARQSKRAYKSLAKIEAADKTVHKEHRKYEGAVAENELGKKRADAGLAKKLHGICAPAMLASA